MGRFRRALEERTGVRFAVSSLSDLYLDRILMVISFPRFYLRFDSCVVCCLHWFEICVLLCCSLSLKDVCTERVYCLSKPSNLL